MNKQELDSALAFIDPPQGELQIILYASLESIAEPRKLDIREEDLSGLRDLFVSSIQASIIEKEDYTVLPLSTADERGNCFYQYDLEVPEGLGRLETIIGNDSLQNFDFNKNKFETSLIFIVKSKSRTDNGPPFEN